MAAWNHRSKWHRAWARLLIHSARPLWLALETIFTGPCTSLRAQLTTIINWIDWLIATGVLFFVFFFPPSDAALHQLMISASKRALKMSTTRHHSKSPGWWLQACTSLSIRIPKSPLHQSIKSQWLTHIHNCLWRFSVNDPWIVKDFLIILCFVTTTEAFFESLHEFKCDWRFELHKNWNACCSDGPFHLQETETIRETLRRRLSTQLFPRDGTFLRCITPT